MATINSIQSFTSISRPGTSRQTALSFDGNLSINRADSDSATISSSSSSRSPDQLAERTVTLRLSDSVGTLNIRQSFVQQQSNTVTALLAKAREIERETDPQRRADLVEDASALIADAESGFTSAVENDANFDDDEVVFVRVDSSVDPGNSSGNFTTTISGVQSLSTLGIDDELSFSADDIDTTIETLENAQSTLNTKLQSFESTRASISNEVATRKANASLQSEASSESIEDVAARLAQEITSSANGLLASSNVEQLNISSLLEEDDDEEENSSSSSQPESVEA